MKHIVKFESFQINEEEGVFRKVVTGHDNKADEDSAREAIVNRLKEIEKDVKAKPANYAQSAKWEEAKSQILDKAKENRYRGSIRVQRGGNDRRLFVVYDAKSSTLQQIGSAASARTGNPLGGND